MTRQCGTCSLCCKVLSVKALPKPANQRCKYQRHTGCSIYERRPPECKLWSCLWLVGDDTADLRRPDRSGYVIDILPDLVRASDPDLGEREFEVVQIRVDDRRPDAWRDDEELRKFIVRRAEEGKLTLIRYDDERARLIVAPPASKEWKEFETNNNPDLLKVRKERYGY